MERGEQGLYADALREELEAYDRRVEDMLYIYEHHEEILALLRARVARLKEDIITSKKLLAQRALRLPRTDEQVQKALNYCSHVRLSLNKLREVLDQRATKTLSEADSAIERREAALRTLSSRLDLL